MSNFNSFITGTERQIVRKLVAAIYSQPGRSVTVDNGDETTGLILNAIGVYKHLGSTDSDWLTVYENGERKGVIWLVWGNGEDLISDYSVSLEELIDPLLD